MLNNVLNSNLLMLTQQKKKTIKLIYKMTNQYNSKKIVCQLNTWSDKIKITHKQKSERIQYQCLHKNKLF